MRLGGLGIAIRGRSTRLTLYRSTHEILIAAERLLGTEDWDGPRRRTEPVAGYRSVLHGHAPILAGYPSWADELAAMATQVRGWQSEDGGPAATGIAVPDRRLMAQLESYLNDHGVPPPPAPTSVTAFSPPPASPPSRTATRFATSAESNRPVPCFSSPPSVSAIRWSFPGTAPPVRS